MIHYLDTLLLLLPENGNWALKGKILIVNPQQTYVKLSSGMLLNPMKFFYPITTGMGSGYLAALNGIEAVVEMGEWMNDLGDFFVFFWFNSCTTLAVLMQIAYSLVRLSIFGWIWTFHFFFFKSFYVPFKVNRLICFPNWTFFCAIDSLSKCNFWMHSHSNFIY